MWHMLMMKYDSALRKKERNAAICSIMDTLGKHYATFHPLAYSILVRSPTNPSLSLQMSL